MKVWKKIDAFPRYCHFKIYFIGFFSASGNRPIWHDSHRSLDRSLASCKYEQAHRGIYQRSQIKNNSFLPIEFSHQTWPKWYCKNHIKYQTIYKYGCFVKWHSQRKPNGPILKRRNVFLTTCILFGHFISSVIYLWYLCTQTRWKKAHSNLDQASIIVYFQW